jgi:hypothetical protein
VPQLNRTLRVNPGNRWNALVGLARGCTDVVLTVADVDEAIARPHAVVMVTIRFRITEQLDRDGTHTVHIVRLFE